jgi:hypothetical protein
MMIVCAIAERGDVIASPTLRLTPPLMSDVADADSHLRVSRRIVRAFALSTRRGHRFARPALYARVKCFAVDVKSETIAITDPASAGKVGKIGTPHGAIHSARPVWS